MNKLNCAERERYCQGVYEEYIVRTAEFLDSCDGIAEILRAYIPGGCYTNFRDMLFHFRRMAQASEETALLSQVASIVEHANRAIRDAEVSICIRCMTNLRMMLMRYSLSEEHTAELRRQINQMQDCVLKLRLGSMMLEGMELLRPSDEDFQNMIWEHFSYMEKHLESEYRDMIAYSGALKRRFGDRLKALFDEQDEDELRNFKACTTYDDVADLVYNAVFE